MLFGLGPAFGAGLVSSSLGMVVCAGLAVLGSRLLGGGLGMGAVKLLAALGAAVGLRAALLCVAGSLAAAVVLALAALWRGRHGKPRKVMGSPLAAAGLVLGVPLAALLGW